MSMLSLGGLLGHSNISQALGGVLSLILAADQKRQDDAARADNIKLGQASLGLAGATGNETMPTTVNAGSLGDVSLGYNPVQDLLNFQKDIGGKMLNQHTGAETRLQDFTNRQLSTYDADSATLQQAYRANMSPITSLLQARYDRGMKNLEGMGDQARTDINRSYDASMGSQSRALSARGLGNSTLLANAMTGNERNRQSSLGNLEESLRAQRLTTDANLSGDVINQQNAMAMGQQALLQSLTSGRQSLAGGLGANLLDLQNQNSAARVAFDQAIGTQRQNLGNQSNANILSILNGTQIGYPDAGNWNAIQNLWSGLGSYKGTQDAMNIQDKQFGQQLTMGALSMGLSPVSAFTGGFAGQSGFNLANRAFKGGGSSTGNSFATSGNGPVQY